MADIRLEIPSHRHMVDLVEDVGISVARMHHMADDEAQDLGLVIRESVTNAIVHGNQEVCARRVSIQFEVSPPSVPTQLVVTVQDQGHGFDPTQIPNPLAPENLLKPSGRGLLFMRAFTEDLSVTRLPTGGTEVRFAKPIGTQGQPPPRLGTTRRSPRVVTISDATGRNTWRSHAYTGRRQTHT